MKVLIVYQYTKRDRGPDFTIGNAYLESDYPLFKSELSHVLDQIKDDERANSIICLNIIPLK